MLKVILEDRKVEWIEADFWQTNLNGNLGLYNRSKDPEKDPPVPVAEFARDAWIGVKRDNG